jgi:CheY-like chemotaxis protein
LTSQGFEVVPVASGEQALDILRNEEISLMISDVRIPGISGLQPCAVHERNTPSFPFCSSLPTPISARRSVQCETARSIT